jgi:outer membrane receptor for ferrienterochelin and colicins
MKNYSKLLISKVIFLGSISVVAQQQQLKDTLMGSGDPVVVTATRTVGKYSQLSLPVTVINAQEIKRTGLLRLQDILQEQTGVAITNAPLGNSLNGYPNPFGQGIQLMGLDPAYTLFLLDGEPLVGRNAGILNTGRIATGNIRQVEIVKGPSSSLYGSEAMAGVINVITQQPESPSLDVQLFRSSPEIYSSSLSYGTRFKKSSLQLFGHQYWSGGYDLDPHLLGKTQDPFRILAGSSKWVYNPSSRSQITMSLRLNNQVQNNRYQVQLSSSPEFVAGKAIDNDFTAFLQYRVLLGEKSKLFFRSFLNKYSNESWVNKETNNALFDAIHFRQQFFKQELEFQVPFKNGSKLLALAGWSADRVFASRYSEQPPLSTFFICLQQEWKLFHDRLSFNAGGRVDKRSDYAARVSPRIALSWQPDARWKVTASAGGGFKAPDFRHMFLNFSNAQIGYSLIGASALSDELIQLQQNGLLQTGASIVPFLQKNPLKPEYGVGWHLRVRHVIKKGSFAVGIFNNRINQLIDLYTLPFARSNGLPIYSYRNAGDIFSRGAEVEAQLTVYGNFSVNLGYQYLLAKDIGVLESIDAQKLYRRDPETFTTTLLTRAQYVGLPNRSRHMGQLKLLYEDSNAGRFAYIRFIYRSAFGWADINGNNVIDDHREMAEGFLLVNLSAAQQINRWLSLQGNVENLLNYTNPKYAPHLPGRQVSLSLFFQLKNTLSK